MQWTEFIQAVFLMFLTAHYKQGHFKLHGPHIAWNNRARYR